MTMKFDLNAGCVFDKLFINLKLGRPKQSFLHQKMSYQTNFLLRLSHFKYNSFFSIFIMAGRVRNSVKLFQKLQNIYFKLGIFCPSQTDRIFFINARNLFFLISLTQMLMLSLEFLLFEAKSTIEFGISFYSTITELGCLFNFLMITWKMPKILDLIGKLENFIEKSL